MDLEGLDSFTLARIAQSEATRRDAAHGGPLPAAFRKPTRPEHSRRHGKTAGTPAGAPVGRKAGTFVPRSMCSSGGYSSKGGAGRTE